MKQLLLFIGICSICLAKADAPGNKPRPSVWVQFVNTQKWTNFQFFITDEDGHEPTPASDTTKYILRGGYGKPGCILFFGLNKQNKHNTDTLFACHTNSNIVYTLDTVINGKLIYSENAMQEKYDELHAESSEEHTDELTDHRNNNSVNIILLISLTGIGLIGLITFFILKRKK